ncbi:tail protein X [Megasphaera hexanoica]|uniref:Tail protein X n=1 Tax=Megasphaera hexanoica TaxID=1675036 RepID=A0ABW7DQI3_9FIRM|nr:MULTISPECIES: tail protein X [Megasphaera]AXB82781.1 phage tail protein [Megasphaera hexanoica]KUH55903.1 phage tail protein [Megasphaera sp. DJF_B143]DAW26865.1 MAG TPA: tail protein [Caudoviricetes sp.]
MSNAYSTVQGDMWDMISYRVYGSEKYVKILLEANPEYRDVVVFPADIVLTCPTITPTDTTKLPPWKR